MNIVNPTDTTHELKIIPRFGLPTEVVFSLYNEETQLTETITNTFSFKNISFFCCPIYTIWNVHNISCA